MEHQVLRADNTGLVQVGIGTQANVTALLALANTDIRWVDSVGLGTVGDGSVKSAREEIGVTP